MVKYYQFEVNLIIVYIILATNGNILTSENIALFNPNITEINPNVTEINTL